MPFARWNSQAESAQFEAVAKLFGDMAWYEWVFDAVKETPDYTFGHLWWKRTIAGERRWTRDVTTPRRRTVVSRIEVNGKPALEFEDITGIESPYNGQVLGARIYAKRTDSEWIVFVPFRGNTSTVTTGSVIALDAPVRLGMGIV